MVAQTLPTDRATDQKADQRSRHKCCGIATNAVAFVELGPNRTEQPTEQPTKRPTGWRSSGRLLYWRAVLVPDERNPALCDAGFFARAPDRGGLWIGRQLFDRLASQVDTTTLPGEPAAADTGR